MTHFTTRWTSFCNSLGIIPILEILDLVVTQGLAYGVDS